MDYNYMLIDQIIDKVLQLGDQEIEQVIEYIDESLSVPTADVPTKLN